MEKHENNWTYNEQEEKESISNTSEDADTHEDMDLSSGAEVSSTKSQRDTESEMGNERTYIVPPLSDSTSENTEYSDQKDEIMSDITPREKDDH